MPDTPDFHAIAVRIIGLPDLLIHDATRAAVVAELVAVWNARGAADAATIETELSMLMGSTMAGPYVKNLDRALRTLDR